MYLISKPGARWYRHGKCWKIVAMIFASACLADDGLCADRRDVSLCPENFFEPIGDLTGDLLESVAGDVSANGKKVVGGSASDDPSVPNDGHSEIYAHAYQALGWTRPCEQSSFFTVKGKGGKKESGGPGLFGLGYPFAAEHAESGAIGISPDGDVVVGFSNEGTDNHHQPAAWQGGSVLRMNLLAGDKSGNATDISDEVHVQSGKRVRVVIGYSHRELNHPRRAAGSRPVFWWLGDPNARALDLPVLVPPDSAEASCISDDARILGGNLYDSPPGFDTLLTARACAWWYDSQADRYQPILLPWLEGSPGKGTVFGISGDGQILVGNTMKNGELVPCYWRQLQTSMGRGKAKKVAVAFGGPFELPLLPGHVWGVANCANYDGSVIAGESDPFADDFIGDAVRWRQFGAAESLKDIFNGLGFQAHSGWLLDGVSRISADGRTLIGNGFHPAPINPTSEFDVIEGWTARVP